MKKSLLILGLLAIVMVNAQQSGKVGINTSSPKATFHIKSTTGNNERTNNLLLENAGGNKMLTVLDNGFVGIATEFPSVPLDVNGGVRFRTLYNTIGSNNDKIVVVDNQGRLKSVQNSILGTNASHHWTNDWQNSLTKLTYLSNGSTLRADNNNIFISDNGFLGIKTQNFLRELSVDGGIYATKGIKADETIASNRLTLEASDGGFLSSNIKWEDSAYRFVNTTYGNFEGGWLINSNYAEGIPFALSVPNNDPMYTNEEANLYVSFVINRNGYMGINKYQPTERLEVGGNVRAMKFLASDGSSIFPDYVFQKYYNGKSAIKTNYQFKSLPQIEDFVKANGHLPGYKSAQEIKTQGYVDLMETQLTNVEKIEELYLHLMEKDKELKELKKQNEELQSRLERLEKLLSLQ